MKHRMIPLLLAAILPGGVAVAQDGQGAVMRALDESFSIQIDDKPIAEALDAVSDKTGLVIELGDNVLAHLPHGEETRVRIKAREVKLRDALSAMLDPMSLRWSVRGMGVVVTPSAELLRINRRPTFTEVGILHRLARVTLKPGRPAIEQLREVTGVKELALILHVWDDPAKAQAVKVAQSQLPCTGSAYLDGLCHGRRWTWYLWGTDLVVTTKQAQARRQLGRRLTARYRNVPLLNVLIDLAHKADLELKMDPGVLNTLKDQTRRDFTLLMAEATIDEALQAISGATGLAFVPDGLALRVTASSTAPATQPAGTRRRFPFVVRMDFQDKHGRHYNVLFRPDDLPAELVEAIKQRKAELLKVIHAEYGSAAAAGPASPDTGERPGRAVQPSETEGQTR